MAATTLTDRAVDPPVRRGRARLPAGAGHQRCRGRASGVGRAADAAGQMPVRFHRLGGWRRPAARLRSRGGRRPDQAPVDLPPAPADPDRARRRRWPCIGRSTATRAFPIRALPSSAAAGSRQPASPAERLARAPPAPRRLRRPRRARRHPLARMQCRRTERRQLHQGLLRRPGKYRPDELARRRSTAGWSSSRPTRQARARASDYPELRLAVEHRRVDDLAERNHSRLAEQRWLSRARRRRGPGRSPCP